MRCGWASCYVVLLVFAVSPAHAQSEVNSAVELRHGILSSDSEINRCEQELAARAVPWRKAQDAEDQQRQLVESLRGQSANRGPDATEQNSDAAALIPTGTAPTTAELVEAQQLLERLGEETSTAQKLHTQAKEKFELAKRKLELEAAKSEPAGGASDKSRAPFDDVLKRRTQAEQATQEAELAQRQTRTLRDQLQTLLDRQQELRQISDELGRVQNAKIDVTATERQRMWNQRHSYTEALRRITEEIQQVREEILLAEATQRIKEEAADEAQTAYQRWKTSLIMSGFLLAAALLLMILARIVLARVVREPEQRYTVNKAFSLATTLIVVFGMMFIFADQFSSLLTLFGFAVAGLAIALQEIVASLAAWFFIRGSRGYTTRDWVQIGSEFGEVVDITFLRTTIQQYQSLSSDGKPVGATPTGGLIVLMNNAVFKHTLVNYTRGYPYIWCSLTYNFSFESNWEQAREILESAMRAEREIVDTAQRAKKNIAEMASSFHIQVASTEPLVRTWVSGVGVELTLRFLAHPRSRPELLDRVNLRVLRAVQQSDDIRFAYWTVRSITTDPAPTAPAVAHETTQRSDTICNLNEPQAEVRKAG